MFLSNVDSRPSTILNDRFGFEDPQHLFLEAADAYVMNLGRSDFPGTCPAMKIFRVHGHRDDVMMKIRLFSSLKDNC